MAQVDSDDNACLRNEQQKVDNFDDILPYVGDFGKYQWTLMATLIVFGSAFTTIYYSQIFITLVPQNHWCKVNELMDLNLTQEQRRTLFIPQSRVYPYYDRCHYKKLNFTNINAQNFNLSNWKIDEIVHCSQWEYDFSEIPYASISTELNWVCEKEYLIATAQSLFYVGSVFGNFIFGWISDRYGRTKGLLCCTVTSFLASIATAHNHNFWSFALCRFFIGFAYDNIIIIPLIIALEYVTPMKRSLIGWLAFGVNFTIGSLTVPWISYFISNWRIFAYANSLPCLLCFLLTLIMPESIRWYMSKGMYHKIIKKLKRISYVNGKSPEPWVYNEFLKNISSNNRKIENATLFDLRKTPHLTKNIILLAIVFSLSTLMMDTHTYYSTRYKMSIFVSFSWFSLEICLASILSKLTANLWGLRFNGFLGLFLVAVFSYTFVFTTNETVKTISGSIGRMSISFVQILYSQYVPEFFPTTFRAQGSALVHFLSVVMHFVAPYLIVLASTWRELPMLIIATLALLNSFLTLFLPETVGKCLRQTLQDGEDFCRNKKFWPIFVSSRK